jgi:Protein of unknown function (DUF3667)
MHTNSCKNCEHKYKGNFCHNCGQKAATHNIDFKFVMHEVPHSAFHVDKGIFFTIKELSLRPGKAIRDYIDGKRIYHFPPLTYVILITTIYVLVRTLQVYFHFDEIKSSQEFQRKHQLAFFLSIIPLYALVYWVFHRKFGYNYWQYLVAQTYITGHFILIILIPNILFFAFPSVRQVAKDYFIVASFGYYVYAYFQMHSPLVTIKWKLLLRELFCFFVASFVSLATTVLIFGSLSKYLKH